MARIKTLQDLFQRYRRPGDLTFAAAFFVISLILLAALPSQTAWVNGVDFFAQPRFWPGVAVVSMAVFSGFHLIGALVSQRIPGRWSEMAYWLRSVEFALWFMAYVAVVPWIGYLAGSILLALTLALRLGYRDKRMLLAAVAISIAVVILFKAVLQVRIPAGEIYQLLPAGGLRTFFMVYL